MYVHWLRTLTQCRALTVLKGHSGAELHIYFLVHLESIYYQIFFYSRIVPNCTVAKYLFEPEMYRWLVRSWNFQFFHEFFPRSISLVSDKYHPKCCNKLLYVHHSESVGKRKKLFPGELRYVLVHAAQPTCDARLTESKLCRWKCDILNFLLNEKKYRSVCAGVSV